MKEGTPQKIIKHLNKRTSGVTELFNNALDETNKSLKNSLTPKQLNLYKAFSSKYIKLVTTGKHKEAEELKIKFENEQI